MAMAPTPIRSRGPVVALDLGNNVDEHEALRELPDGTVKLVVVGYGFTVTAMQSESFEEFKLRINCMLERVIRLHGMKVIAVKWHRREKHRPWATIDLATPAAALPEPAARAVAV